MNSLRWLLINSEWASEILKKLVPEGSQNESRLAVNEIDNANELLVELTDMLVSLRQSDDINYLYSFESTDVSKVLEKTLRNMNKHIQDKKIDFTFLSKKDAPFAMVDVRRIQFAFQIVIENAVVYTHEGGKISLSITEESGKVVITIVDNGIGISKDDLSRIFNKFWRSKEAKTTDTEGMGIGLFMAREIIERHDGEIYAFSEGVGRGSTFTIKLPLVKE
jgi:signal transduction histidine kinase